MTVFVVLLQTNISQQVLETNEKHQWAGNMLASWCLECMVTDVIAWSWTFICCRHNTYWLFNQCLNCLAFTSLSFQSDQTYIREHLCFMASVLWLLKGFDCCLSAGSSTQGFNIMLMGTSPAWMFTVLEGFEPWLILGIPLFLPRMSVIDNCCHHGCHLTNFLTASVPLWQHLSLVKSEGENTCEDTHQANIYLGRHTGTLHSDAQSRSRTVVSVFTTPRVALGSDWQSGSDFF